MGNQAAEGLNRFFCFFYTRALINVYAATLSFHLTNCTHWPMYISTLLHSVIYLSFQLNFPFGLCHKAYFTVLVGGSLLMILPSVVLWSFGDVTGVSILRNEMQSETSPFSSVLRLHRPLLLCNNVKCWHNMI